MPIAGPTASQGSTCASGHCAASAANSVIVAVESVKPMALTKVSTLPTIARGALAAVSALNCGESPDTVAPHHSSQAPPPTAAPRAARGASNPHRPLLASWKAATREPPTRRASAPPATQATPPSAIVIATPTGPRRALEARRDDGRDQHEEGIQLPHVAEVAEGRGAHTAVAPDHGQRARRDARAGARCGPSGTKAMHQQRHRRCPRRRWRASPPATTTTRPARAAQRRGAAQHQRADQHAQRPAQALREPAGGDLHAHRVDAGQRHAGEEAQRQQQLQLRRQQRGGCRARRPAASRRGRPCAARNGRRWTAARSRRCRR